MKLQTIAQASPEKLTASDLAFLQQCADGHASELGVYPKNVAEDETWYFIIVPDEEDLDAASELISDELVAMLREADIKGAYYLEIDSIFH